MRLIGVDYGLKRTGIAIAEVPVAAGGVAGHAAAGRGGQTNADSGTGATDPFITPSAPPRAMALPFEMFENLSDLQLAAAIAQLAQQEHVVRIIIGLPLHADGTISPQSKVTERFIALLRQHTSVPVEPVTEYLSTHDAEGKLAGHFTRQQKRQRVDALAAARILQDYLDQRSAPPATD